MLNELSLNSWNNPLAKILCNIDSTKTMKLNHIWHTLSRNKIKLKTLFCLKSTKLHIVSCWQHAVEIWMGGQLSLLLLFDVWWQRPTIVPLPPQYHFPKELKQKWTKWQLQAFDCFWRPMTAAFSCNPQIKSKKKGSRFFFDDTWIYLLLPSPPPWCFWQRHCDPPPCLSDGCFFTKQDCDYALYAADAIILLPV